jgi:hypothetical protein
MALPFFNAYRGSIGRFFQGDLTLVCYWQLDGSSIDNSGNGNNGTDTAVSYGSAYSRFNGGRGGYFNGSSSYIDAGNGALGGNITVSVWVYPQNISTDWAGIVSKNSGQQSGTAVFWFGQHSTDGALRFGIYLNGSTETPLDTGVVITNKKWYYLVATYDGHYQKIYVDGKLVAVSSDLNSVLPSNTSNYWIGKSTAPTPFNGYINEVAIFSRALSPAEISQYYQWATSQPRKTYYEVGELSVPNTRRRLLLSM